MATKGTNGTILTIAIVAVGGFAAWKLLPILAKKLGVGGSSGSGAAGGADSFSPWNPFANQNQNQQPQSPFSLQFPKGSQNGSLQGADAPGTSGYTSTEFAQAWDAVNGYNDFDNETFSQEATDMLNNGASLDYADESLLNSPAGQIPYQPLTDDSQGDLSSFSSWWNNFLSTGNPFSDNSQSSGNDGLDVGSIVPENEVAMLAESQDYAPGMATDYGPNQSSDGSSDGNEGNVGGDNGSGDGGNTNSGDDGGADDGGGGDYGSDDGGSKGDDGGGYEPDDGGGDGE